ncbi:MAG TPA: hypothetical protein VHB25_15180 [Gemmatimonadaceae bacterium]|nr:hypothetical protein [Gemmatimonadaceae bacterium]
MPLNHRLIAAALSLCLASAARAQLPIPSMALVGGVSHYTLSSSSGSTPIGALRVDIPVVVAVLEGSLAAFRPQDAGAAHTYIIPEAQLQWQLFPTIVRPYLGAGLGWFKSISGSTPHGNDLTTSLSAGVRVGIPLVPITGRAEIRVRGIGGFSDHATELTIGGSW